MGKKGKWFPGVKNPFKSSPKESTKLKENVAIINHGNETDEQPKNGKTKGKYNRRWSFGKSNSTGSPADTMPSSNMMEKGNVDVQKSRSLTATAAEATVAEMAHLHGKTWMLSNNEFNTEEAAAIKIQTAFRGYLARKSLRALRGVVRLQALIQGHTVRKQSVTTLRCMQALVRVQARVRARRVHMSEEGQAAQRQLWQRREAEMLAQKWEEGETRDWDDSIQSMKEVEAKKLSKQEAGIKRERALAYAFAHQLWRTSPNQASTDLEKPQWGWSWLERWMATRPWDSRIFDKDASEMIADADDSAAKKTSRTDSGKPAYTPNGLLGKEGMVSTAQQRKHTSHNTQAQPVKKPPSATYARSGSPRSIKTVEEEDGSLNGGGPKLMSSKKNSKAGSVFADDESLLSLSTLPNYMISTKSAQAKARSASNPKHRPTSAEREEMLMTLAKKRLSYPATGRSDAGYLSTPKSSRTPPSFVQKRPTMKVCSGSSDSTMSPKEGNGEDVNITDSCGS